MSAIATRSLKEETAQSRGRGGFRDVLAITAFRRLWLAQLGSQLGEVIALVAMPLLVYGLTGSVEPVRCEEDEVAWTDHEGLQVERPLVATPAQLSAARRRM